MIKILKNIKLKNFKIFEASRFQEIFSASLLLTGVIVSCLNSLFNSFECFKLGIISSLNIFEDFIKELLSSEEILKELGLISL